MGPITHPEIVNERVSRFLERHRSVQPADLLRIKANRSHAGLGPTATTPGRA